MINKKYQPNIFTIIGLFTFVFGSCLAIFNIPIQSEAISYIPKIYNNIIDINKFIIRSPIEKSFLYFIMKLAPSISKNHTSNIYFIFYLTYHLITSLILYYFIQRIINIFKLTLKKYKEKKTQKV